MRLCPPSLKHHAFTISPTVHHRKYMPPNAHNPPLDECHAVLLNFLMRLHRPEKSDGRATTLEEHLPRDPPNLQAPKFQSNPCLSSPAFPLLQFDTLQALPQMAEILGWKPQQLVQACVWGLCWLGLAWLGLDRTRKGSRLHLGMRYTLGRCSFSLDVDNRLQQREV